MTRDQIITEAKTLFRSFIGAVGAAALLAALNWLGAHIPAAISFTSTLAAAYGSQKLHSA